MQRSTPARLLDDLPRDPILLGEARREVFELGDEPPLQAEMRSEPRELDAGGAVDGVHGGGEDGAHTASLPGSLMPPEWP